MLVSIVTINLNNLKGLQKTIDSVVTQIFKDFEWIIIDGGSTDGSRELIEQYADHFAYWVSEPDKGIYNAMNKGIKVAKGEYCLFMNSGDWLSSKQILSELFSSKLEADIVSCDVFFEKSNYASEVYYPSPDTISMEYFNHNSLPHQGSLIRKSLFTRYGYYDESLKIVSDWVFFVDVLINHNVSYQHIKLCLAHCETEGLSNNPKYSKIIEQETVNSLYQLMPRHADAYLLLQHMYQIDRDPQFQYFKTFRKTRLFWFIWGIHKRMKRIKQYCAKLSLKRD